MKMRLMAFIAILMLPAMAQDELDADTIREHAYALVNDGLVEAAIPLYQRLSDDSSLSDGERASSLSRLAELQTLQGDLKGASATLKRLKAEYPDHWAEDDDEPEKVEEQKLPRDLSKIIIPELMLEPGTTVKEALATLEKLAMAHDPEGKGVNIQLRVTNPGGMSATGEFSFEEENTIEAGDLAGKAKADSPGTMTTMGLNLRKIPLMEALRYLCLQAGLHYRVEENLILVAKRNVALEEMESRFYAVRAEDIGVRENRFFGAFPDDDDDDDDDDGVDPKVLFTKLGVEFPEGARISYDARMQKLIVYNTSANLAIIEEILKALDSRPRQVALSAEAFDVAFPAELQKSLPATWDATTLAALPASQRHRISRLSTMIRADNEGMKPLVVQGDASLTIRSLQLKGGTSVLLDLLWEMPGPGETPYCVDTKLVIWSGGAIALQLDHVEGRERFLVISANVITPDGKTR